MLRQEAESAARIARLEELLACFARATRDRFRGTDRGPKRRTDVLKRWTKKIATLIDARIRADDPAADTDKRFATPAESQAKTEEAIRNLAETVDRHIAEGHSRQPRGEV